MRRIRRLYALLFIFAIGGALVAVVAGAWPGLVVAAAFAAVISAALMIALGAESAQFFVSQGFAVAVIALLQILPEFTVEATIAWRGDIDLMLANFTGSNRLLMGLGWPMIYGVAAFYHRRGSGGPLGGIHLRPEAVIEVLALLAPSLYFLLVLEKGTLTVADAAILAAMFVVYIVLLSRLPPEGEASKATLVPPSRWIVDRPRRRAKGIIVALLAVGGACVVLAAGPFVTSLEFLAVSAGLSSFLFIQWVAPFLSEFPEKVSAFYWAKRVRLAPMALLNMVSSKVNQWTLLVLFIPTFYSLGLGRVASVPLSEFQKHEILLSIAMTVYGGTVLLTRRFTATNASVLLGLWLFQFLFPTNVPGTPVDTRWLTTIAFLGLTVVELVWRRSEMHPIRDLRDAFDRMVRRDAAGGGMR